MEPYEKMVSGNTVSQWRKISNRKYEKLLDISRSLKLRSVILHGYKDVRCEKHRCCATLPPVYSCVVLKRYGQYVSRKVQAGSSKQGKHVEESQVPRASEKG